MFVAEILNASFINDIAAFNAYNTTDQAIGERKTDSANHFASGILYTSLQDYALILLHHRH